MKSFIIITSIISCGILSCSKNRGVVSNNLTILTAHDVEGKWQVSFFSDSDINKTTSFSAISIQLNSDGSLNISQSDTILSGSWLIKQDVGLDKLSIKVTTSEKPYILLQEEWFVQGKTNNTLSLVFSHDNTSKIMELER